MTEPSFSIFGPPRSGTTLMAFMLSGQPGLFVLNDSFVFDRFVQWSLVGDVSGTEAVRSRVIIASRLAPHLLRTRGQSFPSRALFYAARERYAQTLRPDRLLEPHEISSYQQVLRARYVGRSKVSQASFLSDYAVGLVPSSQPLTVRDLLSRTMTDVARLFSADSSVLVFGEKTPLHTMYANWITSLYPELKVVLLVRDPIANIASIYRRNGRLRRAVAMYQMYAQRLMSLADRPNVMTVRYEDLTDAPREAMSKIVGFLDSRLGFDPACTINAYTKSEYTGRVIDQFRNSTQRGLLTETQRDRLHRRFDFVIQRFYR